MNTISLFFALAACGADCPEGTGASTDTAPGAVAPGIDASRLDAADALVEASGVAPGGDLLVILLDDVGVDKVGAYGEHASPAPTPTLDALAAQGVRFTSAWAQPSCSPARASLLTGLNPSQTGVGEWIDPSVDDVRLDPGETSIPDLLRAAARPYFSAVAGKWHLITWVDEVDPPSHPLEVGFDHHAGSLGNPKMAWTDDGLDRGYEYWERSEDGEVAFTTTYMTTDTTDAALRYISEAEGAGEPWFVYVAYNGPHDPLHPPPDELIAEPVSYSDDDHVLYAAMLEAVDAEIGRLLEDAPPGALDDATIVVLGDNGTPAHSILEPWPSERGKHSLFEGGLRVPMIVVSPYASTPGAEVDALVQITDLFATAAQIAGISREELGALAPRADSVSWLPYLIQPDLPSLRRHQFAERFDEGYHNRALRTEAWKYIRRISWIEEELYRLEPGDHDDGEDVLADGISSEERAALAELRACMDAQLAWNDGD